MSTLHVNGAPTPMKRCDGGELKLSTFVPLKIRKRGGSKVIVHPSGDDVACGERGRSLANTPMLVALSRAFYWLEQLDAGTVSSGSEIASREGLHHSTVNELLRLTLLDPAIIQAIVAGRQPRCLSLLWFQRNPLPVDWCQQRHLMDSFDE